MAPPTILYNNTSAKYTKYEQTNSNLIDETEVAVAKAMLTQDIATFNTSAPIGNKDTNFSVVTGTSPQLTHLMINHQQNDLGSVFAIAAEHNFDNTNNVSGSSSNHVSFSTNSGSIGSNFGGSTVKPIYVTNDSASYYDSQIVVSTDNSEHVFYDNEEVPVPVGTNKKYEVTYDSSSSNFNAEKAVNSRYSNYLGTNGRDNTNADPNGDKTDPLVVYESTTFNSGDSLYTERVVSRNSTTNELTASGTITNAMKTLVNESGQKYYDNNGDFVGSGFIGIEQVDQTASNDRAFFGAVKVTQTSDDVIDISGNAAGSTNTTLAMFPNDPGSALPTSMTKAQFDNLFTEAELPYVGNEYTLDVRAYTDDETTGGYYTDFRGFTTDDTYVKRNTTYMRKCAEEGNNFADSVQTVEIHNGDLVATRVFTGPNADLLVNRVDEVSTDASGNPTPHDTDENLDVNQYTNDYWVRTYFTSPSLPNEANYFRAEADSENTTSYTDFSVYYDSTENNDGSVLPDDRRERYYDKFDITTVFPNTSVTDGAVFSGSNYIGEDNGFAAVFQSGFSGTTSSGINVNTDYTFTSSPEAAALLADEEIALIQLVNTRYMAQEQSFYAAGFTTPVAHTNATVVGTNIDYTTLADSTDSSKTDLRIQLTAKTGLSASSFTNDWSASLSTGSVLQTDLAISGIFGNSISSIMTDVSTEDGNTGTIPISFELLTNGTADNKDSLDYSIGVSWSYEDHSRTLVIPESDITLTGVNPTPVTTDLTLGTHYTLPNNLSTVVSNLLGNYKLVRNVETRTTTPSFMLAIGPYNNVKITGHEITMRTVYHTLVHKDTGVKLSDSYLKNVTFTGTYLTALQGLDFGQSKASRQLIGDGKSSTLTLAVSDLYGFKAVVQKKDGSSWVNTSPSYDFDGAYNNFTTFTLNSGAGSVTGSIDITTDSTQNVVLNQSTYYIELTTAATNITYSVAANKWNINTLADSEAITEWAASNDVTSTIMPNGGTSISLFANVANTDDGNSTTQPVVTLTVTDASGNIWAKFVTNNVISSASFNVLFARRPVFHVVETYKNVYITVPTSTNGISTDAVATEDASFNYIDTYLMAGSSTMLQVIDGIQLTFNNDTAIGDSASYRLLGDYVEASLYSGYDGPYSTLQEVTFANGLVIGNSKARHIDITFYRGNSVATNEGQYEEFRWTRRLTQIQMKIVNTDACGNILTYTDSLSDIYNGSIHTVTDLSGTIGDLHLKFNGHLSRFRNVNIIESTNQDVNMSQLITIVFDAYKWSISNPYNTFGEGAGAPNALSDASGIVFTNEYSIVNYTGSNPMNIVASRVWIREEDYEVFNLYYRLPTLKVDYLAEQYVGDPSTFTWSGATRIDTITYAELNSGYYIKTPSEYPDGSARTVKDSLIYIRRAPISVQDHVGYFLLPRPQHVVEAIATNVVSGLPYNFTDATRTTRYFDINLETNTSVGHKPFAGGFGLSNGIRVINDMNIRFNNDEKYVDRRYQSAENLRKIYIPSNKVKVELYKGNENHTTVNSGLKISTVYEGYIHKLANYDVDSIAAIDSTNAESTTAIESTIYNTYKADNNTTYIDSEFNKRADMTYDLYFSQDHTIISPQITSDVIYGELGNQIVNIQTEGYAPFMNLADVGVASRHLDLLTGDSVKLVLYGHTFTTDACGNLVAEFVRYTTGTGYDFSTNAAEIFITNLGFNASTRETAKVIVSNKSSTLSATPYNFIVDCNNTADSLSTLTWETDSTWSSKSTAEKQLYFNMVCLSTVGQVKLTEILGVSARSPFRILVCNYPNRIDLRSGDGSPLYVVNAFGKLTCLVVNSQVIELTPQSYNSSDNVEEYGAYNTLLGNTV